MSRKVTIEIDAEHLQVLLRFAKSTLETAEAARKAHAEFEAKKAEFWAPEIRKARYDQWVAESRKTRDMCSCRRKKAGELERAYWADSSFYLYQGPREHDGLGSLVTDLIPEGIFKALRALSDEGAV